MVGGGELEVGVVGVVGGGGKEGACTFWSVGEAVWEVGFLLMEDIAISMRRNADVDADKACMLFFREDVALWVLLSSSS